METDRLTINKLAMKSGISVVTLYRRLDNPQQFRICELAKIAKALKVPVFALMNDV